MKRFTLLIILIILVVFVPQSYGQRNVYVYENGGYIITRNLDTIKCTKIESYHKRNYMKYWIDASGEELTIRDNDRYAIIIPSRCEMEIDEIDEFSGKKKLKTETVSLGITPPQHILDGEAIGGYNTLDASLAKITSGDSSNIYLYLSSFQLGCSGTSKNYLMLKFKDGEVLKFDKDLAEINCSRSVYDIPESIFYIDTTSLRKILTKELSASRFCQSEGYIDIDCFYPDVLMNLAALIEK